MPIFSQHTDVTCTWGIWRISETEDELLAMLPHAETYRSQIQSFGNANRRLEWLAARVLLYSLLGKEKEIAYYRSGRPYLADESASISISHTRGYAAVVVGDLKYSWGVDIEQYGERVHRVAERFMRPDEVSSVYQGTDTWSLLLHWSAKEALYKCLGMEDVDFLDHLRIYPFEVQESGSFMAEEYRTEVRRRMEVYYHLAPDFVWTLCKMPVEG